MKEPAPECGEDFCDTCGDCLSCFPGECFEGKQHVWVIDPWGEVDADD
jgi:hypothetical protein